MAPRPAKLLPQINLLRVKSNAERAVVLRLRELDVRAYAPQYLEYRKSGPVAHVLFDGYVFVWPESQWQRVGRTRGVLCFVNFGEAPEVVPQGVVDELRALEGPTGYIRLEPRFNRWKRVRVASGESVGVAGIVQAQDGPTRVIVLFRLLGREIKMSVPERDLVAA